MFQQCRYVRKKDLALAFSASRQSIALPVHPLIARRSSPEARAFYEHFDFIASPSDPMHLFLLLKDIKALID